MHRWFPVSFCDTATWTCANTAQTCACNMCIMSSFVINWQQRTAVGQGQRWNRGRTGAVAQKEAEEAMPHRKELAKSFTGILYQFSTIRKTSVTDNIIEWSLGKIIFGCATGQGGSKKVGAVET